MPADKEEATRVVRRSKNYVLVGDKLYRRAASSVLLKCVSFEEGKEILDEIHLGCCGNHAASRTLVGKVFRTGFYWPTALKDAEELVRNAKVVKCSQDKLMCQHTISSASHPLGPSPAGGWIK